jgi:hypothetical protein
MQVSDVQLLTSAEQCELQAKVRSPALGDEPFLLWYRFPVEYSGLLRAESGNAFVAALLLPAMRAGEPLVMDLPVSKKLLRAVNGIQEIYRSWDPSLSEIIVTAPAALRMEGGARGRDRGLFFSLGLDSFYSLLKNVACHPNGRQSIRYLIQVHGFDFRLNRFNQEVLSQVLSNGRKVAQELGKKTIPVVTNLRDILDRFAKWGPLGHGAALASVGLSLEGFLQQVYIAGGPTYVNLHPCGSHPMLDPMWSTERLSFVYDGAESERPAKTQFIAQFPLALKYLRVCFHDESGEYNCGRCWKCLTMRSELGIVGALPRCGTLPQAIDLERVRETRIPARFLGSVLSRARAWGGDPELEALLEERLDEVPPEGARAKRLVEQLADRDATIRELRAQLDGLRGARVLGGAEWHRRLRERAKRWFTTSS